MTAWPTTPRRYRSRCRLTVPVSATDPTALRVCVDLADTAYAHPVEPGTKRIRCWIHHEAHAQWYRTEQSRLRRAGVNPPTPDPADWKPALPANLRAWCDRHRRGPAVAVQIRDAINLIVGPKRDMQEAVRRLHVLADRLDADPASLTAANPAPIPPLLPPGGSRHTKPRKPSTTTPGAKRRSTPERD